MPAERLSATSDDSQIAASNEANTAAFLMEMGRAGGGEQRSADEIEWTIGGSPIGYHNAVIRATLPGGSADDAIASVMEALRRYQVPGTWHLSPSMSPADLEDRLLARGWAFGGEEPAMAAPISDTPAPALPVGLEITPVASPAQLDDWASTLAKGFGEGEEEAFWARDVFAKLGYGESQPWWHLVARLDGKPAATATVFFAAGVAGIYFVMTVPELRRKGIGAAVTYEAMRRAEERGYEVAVLGSSEMGYGVYRSLGFRELFRYRLLEWRPERA